MSRISLGWAAASAALALAGCGDARTAAAPFGGESGCASCHSAPGEAPPFRDRTGSTDPTRLTIGAHDAHLHPNLRTPLDCAECHTVPRSVGDPGHLEDTPEDISFGTLARTGGASPSYVQPTCSAVYCHGNFPGGNTANVLQWLGGPPGQAACGTCHGLPPPTGRHEFHMGVSFQGAATTCTTCHGPFLLENHVNGVKNVALPGWNGQTRNCAVACHGERPWG